MTHRAPNLISTYLFHLIQIFSNQKVSYVQQTNTVGLDVDLLNTNYAMYLPLTPLLTNVELLQCPVETTF